MRTNIWLTPFILAIALLIQTTASAFALQPQQKGTKKTQTKKGGNSVKTDATEAETDNSRSGSRSAASNNKKTLISAEEIKKPTKPRVIVVVGALPEAYWTLPYTYIEMEDTLASSGRFTVLSRRQDIINTISNENSKAQSDRADPQEAIAIGKQLTARYVVIGNCLNVSQKAGLKEKFSNMIGKKKVDVELQIQLVDVEKGSLLDSKRYNEFFEVKNYSESTARSLSNQRDPYGNTNNLTDEQKAIINGFKQMMSKVARDYIDHCNLVLPVQGLVADIVDNQVIIDVGTNVGIKAGDELEVYIEGRTIYNVEGKPISQIIKTFAKIRVARVEPKAAWADVIQTFDGDVSKPDPTANISRIKSGQAVRLSTISSKTTKDKKTG